MTQEEKEEFERNMREDTRMELLQEAQHEYAMAEDVDYAAQYLQSELDQYWIDTYKYLKKECYKYNVDFKELLDNL
jgi:hypothetical protein